MVVDSYDSHVEVKPMICIHLRCGSSHWIHSTMDEAEAALIDAGYIEPPEGDDAVELSEDEEKELRAFYDQGFEYIARDCDNKLFAYKEEPCRDGGYWFSPGGTQPVAVEGAFLFVDADAREARSIAWLLCE
jgi:elongation factor P hydroxylase